MLDQIVQSLENINENITRYVIPAIITALVSVLALIINTLISYVESSKTDNMERFSAVCNIYPQLMLALRSINLHASAMKVALQSLNATKYGISDAVYLYFYYRKDEVHFYKQYPNSNAFIEEAKQYMEQVQVINSLLKNNPLPLGPRLHPIITAKVYGMLSSLQTWCFVLSAIDTHPENYDSFFKEVGNAKLDDAKAKEYILLSEKWFRSYGGWHISRDN